MRVGGETTLVSHQQGVQCELPPTQDRNRQIVCTISDCYKWKKKRHLKIENTGIQSYGGVSI